MEWAVVVGAIAGVVSGVGSGLFAAWLGPVAEARAERTRLRFAARRQIVDLGRELVSDLQGNLDHEAVAHDPRFLRIQPHLDSEVLNFYSWEERQRRREQRVAAMDLAKALRLQKEDSADATAEEHRLQDQRIEQAQAEVQRLQTQQDEEARRHLSMIANLNRLEHKWKLI